MSTLPCTRINENSLAMTSQRVGKSPEVGNPDTTRSVYYSAHLRRGLIGDGATKLLAPDHPHRWGSSRKPLSVMGYHDNLFHQVTKRNVDKIREESVDITVITEDLELVTPEAKLLYKPLTGDKWRTLPPTTKDPEKVEKLRSQILEIVKSRRYDEIFIALNKYYRALLPDLTPYAKKVIATLSGLGSKAKELKEWLIR